jgi:hydrogenase maturation factor
MTESCDDIVCTTCADQLSAVRVEWVSDDGTTVHGVEDGELREISVELLDGLRPGDVVLVHGGVALQRAGAEGERP